MFFPFQSVGNGKQLLEVDTVEIRNSAEAGTGEVSAGNADALRIHENTE